MARPPAGAFLCGLGELENPGARGFAFRDGEALFRSFVVRRGADIFAFVDRCPHAGFPLALEADRFLTREGDFILCSAHGALFRIEDGTCVSGPCAGRRLEAWPVRVVDGEVRTA